jgi:hypothetical protein
MVKSKEMKWTGHVTRIGEKRNAYGIRGKSGKKETARKNKTYVDLG